MSKRLNTYVHVVEVDKDGMALNGGRRETFGPSDDLPDWAEKSISNPDVFDGGKDEGDAPAKPVRKPNPAA
jgi:hypothetical protein